ncbi:MAG: hypothetical protein WCH21_01915 [Bacteroidota bacterium]
MKKVVLSALLLAGLTTMTSCKKVYSCECSTLATTINNDVLTITKVYSLEQKMKEKQADASCAQTEEQMNAQNAAILADVNNDYDAMVTVCDVK